MFTFKNYIKVKSYNEAYELIQKKNNVIIGGMLWLKMEDKTFNTAIDLSELDLKYIKESDEEIVIGSMTTLRELEVDKTLNEYTQFAFKKCLTHIVGVQFRNLATIGGSVYGRYGFSDPITLLMALDSYVELYKGGIVPFEEYIHSKPERDIILNIRIKKNNATRVAYISQRNTKTDFPTLNCAMSITGNLIKIAVGARPGKAKSIVKEFENKRDEKVENEILESVFKNLSFGSNMRATKEYRELICKALIKRCLNEMEERDEGEY